MKTKLQLFNISVLLFSTIFAGPLTADSPLTSADYYSNYSKIPAVMDARRSGKAAGIVLKYLLGDGQIDSKAAVINALGWSTRGKKNAPLYLSGLANSKRVSPDDLSFSLMKPEELFVLGYLLAMDDYFKMKPIRQDGYDIWGATAIDILKRSSEKAPDNFTIHFIYSLVEAQSLMGKSFCSVYRRVDSVLRQFPPSKRNMKPGAVASVMKYINLYRDDCDETEKKESLRLGLDQVYAVSAYKKWIVSGTQSGVVMWDFNLLKPDIVKPDFICSSLAVWEGHLFTGSHLRIRRFDGNTWKEYLIQKEPGEGYQLFRSSNGKLMARLGSVYWEYDNAGDRFVQAEAPDSSSGVYFTLYRINGHFWSIRFLNSVNGNGRTYPVNSPSYPGSDPRSIYEDRRGRLWVMDFEKGFYMFNESENRFVHTNIINEKASDVLYDLANRRTFFLHYTDGVHYIPDDGESGYIDLKQLKYMRSFFIHNSGTLFVGGWNGLMTLKEEGGVWIKRKLQVYGEGPR